jgi:hypothetical protein
MTSLHAGEFPRPRNEKPIGREWLQAAVNRAAQRESEGHFGSLHLNHHGDPNSDIFCGALQLISVGSIKYLDEMRDCIFANFLRVPQEIFDMMKAGKLPYRSIEGSNWNDPEISSLALMPTETPFWRLPTLTIGSEASSTEIHAMFPSRIAAKLIGGIPMQDKVEPKIEAKPEVEVKAALPTPPPAPPKKDEKEEKVEEKHAPSETGMKAAGQTAPGGTPEAPGMSVAPGGTTQAAALDNLETHVRGFISGCSKYLKAEMVAPEKPEEKKPAEQVSASANVELATAKAERDVLKAKLDQKEKDEAVNALVASAEKSLIGMAVNAEIRASLREMATCGEVPLKKYVEVLAKGLPAPAPASPDQATSAIKAAATSSAPDETEIMNVLGAQSPEIRARAKHYVDMGRRYIASTRSTVTLREYVMCNLKREGVQV